MATTLSEAIQSERVSFEKLHQRYDPVLQMVDALIGVVPNCDQYLEVWPPGFRSYNLMVPNFLNLPVSLLGRSAPKDVVGLAMYASSRAANCNYCSAHTCSFALRRGSDADALTGASRTHGEAAAVAVAEALSADQHTYTPALGEALRALYSDANAEWIVMSVAMMGFLNKFMDAMGVELEAAAVEDVSALLTPTGWTVGKHGGEEGTLDKAARASSVHRLPDRDSMSTMAQVLRNAPGAVRLEREWMDGMAKSATGATLRLGRDYGYDEPLLSRMKHIKPRRALAAMLRHNLDPSRSELGIGLKSLGAIIYAEHVGNSWLADRSARFAVSKGMIGALVDSVRAGIDLTDDSPVIDDRTAAVIIAARAMSPSPALVDATTIRTVVERLTPSEIVELAVWISISQLQHRLSLWYGLAN